MDNEKGGFKRQLNAIFNSHGMSLTCQSCGDTYFHKDDCVDCEPGLDSTHCPECHYELAHSQLDLGRTSSNPARNISGQRDGFKKTRGG